MQDRKITQKNIFAREGTNVTLFKSRLYNYFNGSCRNKAPSKRQNLTQRQSNQRILYIKCSLFVVEPQKSLAGTKTTPAVLRSLPTNRYQTYRIKFKTLSYDSLYFLYIHIIRF